MQHPIKTAYQARKQQAGMTLLGMLLVCAS
jgi:hypothetical protein